MIQRTVLLLMIIITVGFLYGIFVLISIFTSPPKYHYRIAFIFVDISLVFVIIALFLSPDPPKAAVIKRIKRRPNVVVVATVT